MAGLTSVRRPRGRTALAAGLAALLVAGGCSSDESAGGSGLRQATPTVLELDTAARALASLPLRQADPMTGYDRSALFGPRWSDDIDVPSGHNGCDQRSDIIRRQLANLQLKPGTRGCVPLSGTLRDPYTGQVIAFVRGPSTSDDVQVDHVVALAGVWRTGGRALTPDERQAIAGDPLNLIAVGATVNQAKGDSDASQWLPPDSAAHCRYVARQVAVKSKYRLWVTPPEHSAMVAVLGRCPGEPLPTEDSPEVVVPAPI
jgi:hypothetical protein